MKYFIFFLMIAPLGACQNCQKIYDYIGMAYVNNRMYSHESLECKHAYYYDGKADAYREMQEMVSEYIYDYELD